MFFVYCNSATVHTYDGHTSFTFTSSFPAGFTSRNDLHNCEHDPSYYERSQSNLVKVFFVLHGEVLTGFKHSFKKQLPKVFNIFHFKLIYPSTWIHIILVNHYLPVQTHNNGKEIEKKLLHSIALLHNGNECECCQQVVNFFVNNFNWLTLDTN